MNKICFDFSLSLELLVLLIANFIVIIKCQDIHTDGDILDIYSSTFQMQSLLQAEIKLVNYLKKHSVNNFNGDEGKDNLQLSNNIDKIISKHYLNFDPGVDLENYVSNPFNAFGVISRTAELKDLPSLFQNVPQM